ncbi:unnamed protein product [Sphenostylis stenocarpa]|uniref:Uncharacterized protein n=1 Tax=Sphenostylis stenocarpa TaxID=92480 RepID=A0AA86SX79_9FABA|nr:unnamed protein product [Sphenostylis stenocarpa]
MQWLQYTWEKSLMRTSGFFGGFGFGVDYLAEEGGGVGGLSLGIFVFALSDVEDANFVVTISVEEVDDENQLRDVADGVITAGRAEILDSIFGIRVGA